MKALIHISMRSGGTRDRSMKRISVEAGNRRRQGSGSTTLEIESRARKTARTERNERSSGEPVTEPSAKVTVVAELSRLREGLFRERRDLFPNDKGFCAVKKKLCGADSRLQTVKQRLPAVNPRLPMMKERLR